ncbi:MAG: beta-ketoacyl-[acyl-carrier-protein] synthase family protein [Candidatus Auribacterota bacterium]
MNRDIVITGLGVVSTHGVTLDRFWQAVKEGCPCEEGDFAQPYKKSVFIDDKKLRKAGQFINKRKSFSDDRRAFVFEAAGRALEDAGVSDRFDLGVVIGCSKPTMGRAKRWMEAVKAMKKYEESSVYNVPIAGSVEIPSLYLVKKMFLTGPSLNVTAGCATGLMSVNTACRLIMMGDADIVIAGGVEVIPETTFYACYENMGVLTDSFKHFRPFHKDRNGFIIGEGCAVVILETEESARNRGRKPYCKIEKWAALNDPTGYTKMNPDGAVISELINRLTNNNAYPIDYVNTHGTATRMNDPAELRAFKRSFNDKAGSMSFSATKPVTGHMLGATSAVELAICVLALQHQAVPPTIRLDEPDVECTIDLTPQKARHKNLERVMTLSYGFGGPMAGIVLKR